MPENLPLNPHARTHLPPAACEVYRRVTRGEPIPDGAPGLVEVLELGLAAPGDEPGHYVPADPYQAGQRLLEAEQGRLQDIVCRLGTLPTIIGELNEEYRAGRSGAGVVEYLDGSDAINQRIEEIIVSAREELLTAQPGGPRSPETLAVSLARDMAALDRGVKMRTIYHANARNGAPTREWVQRMTAKGGQVRTLERPFVRGVVIDRAAAFIQDYRFPDDDAAPRVILVQEPAVCALVVEFFNRAWSLADPWNGTPEEGSPTVTTKLQRSILRDLDDGWEQKAVARRHGVSLRTVGHHLEELRKKLGVATLFQVATWWATTEERKLDD